MAWLSLKRAVLGRRYRERELERAYRSVFLCPDGEIVLADLAADCGMYLSPPQGATAAQRDFMDGRKALFARILSCLRISPEEHAALQEAARLETLQLDED
ncbi:hypothetical protein [uncultured Roseibium sp.]|uniref:Bbp19 family protein n=1 Tax=uncultured Roseibium sp. TaxID=1936171 RepID=UPI002593D4CC|nr:hypothetical protein [uncultured Roseibium sp.]